MRYLRNDAIDPSLIHGLVKIVSFFFGELGWCTVESFRLPPKWPGLNCAPAIIGRLVGRVAVFGSHPSSKGLSPGSRVFLYKNSAPNSNAVLIHEHLVCDALFSVS